MFSGRALIPLGAGLRSGHTLQFTPDLDRLSQLRQAQPPPGVKFPLLSLTRAGVGSDLRRVAEKQDFASFIHSRADTWVGPYRDPKCRGKPMCLPEPVLSRIGNSAIVSLLTNKTNTRNLIVDNPTRAKYLGF